MGCLQVSSFGPGVQPAQTILETPAVASKLLTTKFPPLCVFLMELAVQLQTQGAELHLHWLPRLQNAEADQLTNGDFTGFCPSKRIRFCLNEFRGLVLGELLEAGCELYAEVREARDKKVANMYASRSRRRGCVLERRGEK